MYETVLYTLLSVFAVSVISLIGIFFISFSANRLKGFLLLFVGVAVGALLGDALIHLLPEANKQLGAETAALWALGGIFVFFILEKVLHWHHHHGIHEGKTLEECVDCDEKIKPFGFLTIISDGLHNVIDGVIIAAGFLVSVEVGIATTIAVALHEIPQEIGDFGVLMHAGFSKGQALLANFLSGLSAFVGAGIVLLIGTSVEGIVPILSAVAAGSFIYIAMADLIPELHDHVQTSVTQVAAVAVGVALMIGLGYIESDKERGDFVPQMVAQNVI
jgi:zinc and cadmium transporter